ncbi:response regulator transcription factor [Streptomyces sp. Z26]|uniref:response regulator transcription factor n=1 Tax=Streptomyces TaxID=1883 RepID=UPI001F0BDB47|nr:response regulator transcription factor [Streptomyces sp. Z26]
MIRVLVLHESNLWRSALESLLAVEHDLDVVSAPWARASGTLRSLRPQVCLADLECHGSAGTLAPHGELVRQLSGSGCALLVLAHPSRPGTLRRAFASRANGYVGKDAVPQRLVEAIRRVSAGERFVDESLAFGFLEASRIPLTPRELNVLELAAQGASNSDIAGLLHLTSGTVRNYMAAITRKTGARNRVDAIRISQGAGWL